MPDWPDFKLSVSGFFVRKAPPPKTLEVSFVLRSWFVMVCAAAAGSFANDMDLCELRALPAMLLGRPDLLLITSFAF